MVTRKRVRREGQDLVLLACALALTCATVLVGCTTPATTDSSEAVGDASNGPSIAAEATPSAPQASATPSAPTTTPPVTPKPKLTSPKTTGKRDVLHTPGIGTPERRAILAALRPDVEKDLRQRVIFKCREFRVHKGFAFLIAQPLQPNGKPIDYRKTRYARDVEWGFEDQVVALLKQNGSRWRVLDWNIGATDVIYSPWPAKYGAPEDIFGL